MMTSIIIVFIYKIYYSIRHLLIKACLKIQKKFVAVIYIYIHISFLELYLECEGNDQMDNNIESQGEILIKACLNLQCKFIYLFFTSNKQEI